MITQQETLVMRMRERTKIDPTNAEALRVKADELETNTKIYFQGEAADDKDLKRFLGSWARARKFWCELTGEALI